MKKRYLLTLALAGMLVFANPVQVNAMSPNAGGTIVGDQQGNAGDTIDIGDENVPMGDGAEIPDSDTPLAVLSADAQTNTRFSWTGFAVGVATTGVLGTGVWAVLKVRGKKKP